MIEAVSHVRRISQRLLQQQGLLQQQRARLPQIAVNTDAMTSDTADLTTPPFTTSATIPSPTLPTTTIISGTTHTTTTTTDQQGQATVQVIHPPGMVYGAYKNPYNTGNDPSWETDNPATLGRYNNYTNTLMTCGIALNLEFQDGTDLGRLPGQQEDTSLANIAVVAHGYFLPPSSGEYTFYINCDNFGYIWVGEKAINTWSASNWDGYSQIGHGSSPTPNFQFTVGNAVPVTYLYLNAGGPGYSRFGFLSPSEYSSDLSTSFY